MFSRYQDIGNMLHVQWWIRTEGPCFYEQDSIWDDAEEACKQYILCPHPCQGLVEESLGLFEAWFEILYYPVSAWCFHGTWEE